MVTNKNINNAITFLVEIEGGYDKIHKDPDDLGGITRAGISSKWFPNIDLENMTEDEINEFYYDEFYRHFVAIPYEKIRDFLFFTYVNLGVSVKRDVQRHINEMLLIYKKETQIVVDGILGKNTRRHMDIVMDCIKEKEIYGNHERVYLFSFIDYCIREWKSSETAWKHLSGWMNRLYKQMGYVI